MAVIVSDTSPIRALDSLGQLPLLSALFDQVVIPPAVQRELMEPRPRFRPIDVNEIPGAVMRQPSNGHRVAQLMAELQEGEAEAFALAEELGADLLIDEMAGRSVAIRLGLRVTGAVGLLVEAKRRHLITAVIPMLERLRSELEVLPVSQTHGRRAAGSKRIAARRPSDFAHGRQTIQARPDRLADADRARHPLHRAVVAVVRPEDSDADAGGGG